MLYIVATPIGNLEDMTVRAVRLLQEADLIAAEDTRHTGKLLHHFQIKTPQISYHDHSPPSRLRELVDRLVAGETIALVSDAGMPGISDPGYELVCAAVAAGVTIVPIPGACAVTTALAAAGLPTDRFVFEGFLPAKSKARLARLQPLAGEERTIVFYESPHRLREMLADLAIGLGADRSLVLARELTKLHEEFWRGTIGEAIDRHNPKIGGISPLGEYTVLVAGRVPEPIELSDADLSEALVELLAEGVSRSEASRQLAQRTGVSKRQIYQLALQLDVEDDPSAKEVPS
jgi:16S rRNA (cytidine1402-2'-O)-methyltransferase